MEQRITFITIGVKDLDHMRDWYKSIFGWTTMKDEDGIVFFKMNGFILSLFPEDELMEDIGISGHGQGFKRFTLAINMNSEAEVNILFDELKKKNVEIVRSPEKVFWGGYRGYIADPENNYWEIAYNPFLNADDLK